jgi:DNA repair exonuclease SbcCD nuclease subunit
MKVIAIPDLHLGKKFNVTYGDSSIWSTKPLTLVKQIIKEENPDKIIFLGDIFNTSQPSFHSVFSFLLLVKPLDVTVISGNHDIPKTRKKSIMDYLDKYVNVIKANTVTEIYDGNYGIGWCDTQSVFTAKLESTIEHITGNTIFLHGAYNNWDNEMDNVITDSIIKKAKNKNIKLISGHEHISNIRKDTLYHLGSIMPMNIGELGPKYYWTTDSGIVEIKHGVGNQLDDDVILVRKDIDKQGTKPIVVRTNKKISDKDLLIEKKHLDVDIINDFIKQAEKAGFSTKFLESMGFLNE